MEVIFFKLLIFRLERLTISISDMFRSEVNHLSAFKRRGREYGTKRPRNIRLMVEVV